MPVFYTVADFQKDSTHRGYCADCGCTVFPWEYRCRSCGNKVVEDVVKEKEQKQEVSNED